MLDSTLSIAAFVAATSFLLLLFTLFSGRSGRLEERLDSLTDSNGNAPKDEMTVRDFARATLPRMGTPLLPQSEEERTRLKTRLVQAGLYGRQALPLFLGVKMLLIVMPLILGVTAGSIGLVDLRTGLLVGGAIGGFGVIGPSFWLDRRKKRRQTLFRRALPDALDVIVICLDGGLSLPGALRRVAGELRTAHPLLAWELAIVQREVQMGRSTGEALRQFAIRTDLEEVRALASVIIQSERYGASLVKALRTHAETLRTKRLQYAEEMAQKAATKVLFPTVLCILPGIFIVILGPAVLLLLDLFDRIGFGQVK
jgi:tight adherence protein C